MALSPPINGTEEYLAAVLTELKGLRADLAAERAERDVQIEVQIAGQTKTPSPTEQLVDLKEPAEILSVHQERPNLPPLSDEAGAAMARALDDDRSKQKPKPSPKKAGT